MKDAYYFKHDSNARNDPKIKALIKKYGIEGYGRYWIMIETLRESSGYKFEDKPYVWDALAEGMNCTTNQVNEFIDDCINIFELLTRDDGMVYSRALLIRMIKLDEIRQKRSDAARSRWDNE